MEFTRITGLVLIALITASLLTLPTSIIAGEQGGGNSGNEQRSVNARWWMNITVSAGEAIALAYIVRNETYPMFQWTLENNVSLSEKMLARGDYFLHLAINESETNETMAKAHALVATMIYSHAPVTAYILLGKTIRENRVNNTITDETVIAVLNKTEELKGLVNEVIDIATGYNVTIPSKVYILKTTAEGYINISKKLLEQGYVKAALRYAVKAYHRLVLAYSFVVKTTIAQKLRLGEPENLTLRMGLRRISKQVLEKIFSHLPEKVREFIMERIHGKPLRSPEELRHIIKDIMHEYYRLKAKHMINKIAMIATHVVLYVAMKPTEEGQAVRTWLVSKGFLMGGHHGRRARIFELYRYIKNITLNIFENSNATGLALLNATLQELSIDIEQTTGVHVDLVGIFYTEITVHIHMHYWRR